MEVDVQYIIKINARDAKNLKNILGSMNDKEFAAYGVVGEDRERMTELYYLLPEFDDDDE